MTGSSVAWGDGWLSDIKDGGDVDIVPFLLGESVGTKNNISDPRMERIELTPSSFDPSF